MAQCPHSASVRARDHGDGQTIAVTADAADRSGRTPLHYAALQGTAEQVRSLLLDGADIAAVDKQGFTPLHLACRQYRPDIVEVLVDAGAPIDALDAWGNTPLFRAVFNANADPCIVRRLVAAGADPDKPNASGRTPRELADAIASYDTSQYFDGRG